MTAREVWITGVGVVSAAGTGRRSLRTVMLAGTSALRYDDALGCAVGRNGDRHRTASSRRLDRSARLFLAAAEEAWADSGLDPGQLDPRRCALIEGSSLGPLSDVLEEHRRIQGLPGESARPSGLIRFMTGAGGAMMAQIHGLGGPVLHLSAASVSAMCAIGEGCEKISAGSADLVIAGGAESPLDRDVVATFRAAGVLARSPANNPVCRPFDLDRSGTALAEGAGVLIIESKAHALRRGARPRARLTGFGFACEHFSLTSPNPDGAGVAAATIQALAGSDPGRIGWIKSHGTGTVSNDAAECAGLAQVVGHDGTEIPLTSLKSTLGHCLGASGAVEAVATLICLEEGIIPATVGTTHPDPSLALRNIVTEVRPSRADEVLLLAESFGGRCAALRMALL